MKSDRGAAVVEFALVVPLLIVLVMGIAEFGRAYFIQSTLSGAAREGVRSMALSNTPATAVATAKAATVAAAPGLGLTSGQIQVRTNGVVNATCPTTGTATISTTVTITYSLTSMTGMFFTDPITLTGKGVMRCNG